MERLQALYGDWFSQIFRSITTDNGNEFAAFSAFEALGSDIHCADLLFAAGIGVLPGKIFVAVLLKSCLKNNRMEPMLQIDMQLYSDPVFKLLITISEHSQCVCVRSDLHFVSHLNYTNYCCGHQPLYATKPWAIRP